MGLGRLTFRNWDEEFSGFVLVGGGRKVVKEVGSRPRNDGCVNRSKTMATALIWAVH